MDHVIYDNDDVAPVYCYFDKMFFSVEQDSLNGVDHVTLTRNQARELMRTLSEYLGDGKDAEFVAENA